MPKRTTPGHESGARNVLKLGVPPEVDAMVNQLSEAHGSKSAFLTRLFATMHQMPEQMQDVVTGGYTRLRDPGVIRAYRAVVLKWLDAVLPEPSASNPPAAPASPPAATKGAAPRSPVRTHAGTLS